MHRLIEAIYEDGVLRPLEKLSLRQKQRVILRIDEGPVAEEALEDKGFLDYCRAKATRMSPWKKYANYWLLSQAR